MTDNEKAKIPIGGQMMPIRMPVSYAVVADIQQASAKYGAKNIARTSAAALGVCWQGPELIRGVDLRVVQEDHPGPIAEDALTAEEAAEIKKKFGPISAQLDEVEFDVLVYGGKVYDELRGRGFSAAEVQNGGALCWKFLIGIPLDTPNEEIEESLSKAVEEIDKLEGFTEADEAPLT